MRTPSATIPLWSSTVGLLKEGVERGCTVTAYCSRCKTVWPVDLDAIIAEKGENYSLWNRRPRCKGDCPGRVFFSANAAPGTPLINLRDGF